MKFVWSLSCCKDIVENLHLILVELSFQRKPWNITIHLFKIQENFSVELEFRKCDSKDLNNFLVQHADIEIIQEKFVFGRIKSESIISPNIHDGNIVTHEHNLHVSSFKQLCFISWLIMHMNSHFLGQPSICQWEDNLHPLQVLILNDHVCFVSETILSNHFNLSIDDCNPQVQHFHSVEDVLEFIVEPVLDHHFSLELSSCKQATCWYIISNFNHWKAIQHFDPQAEHFHSIEDVLDFIVEPVLHHHFSLELSS